MIYLDQAATSFPKIKEVQDAVIDCMNHCTNANRSTSVTRSSLLVFWAVEVSIGVTRSIRSEVGFCSECVGLSV